MQIFLSYSSEHRDVADQVQLGLLAAGHGVFFDRQELAKGVEYDGRIADEIARCDLLVFLVGQRSVEQGSYARTELKFARQRWPSPEGRVLPVLVDKVPMNSIPPYLRAVSILEPEGNLVAETAAEVERLAGLLDGSDLDGGPSFSARGRRRGALFGRTLARRHLVGMALALLLTLALFFAGDLSRLGEHGYQLARVMRLPADAPLPLRPAVSEALAGAIGRLARVVQQDVQQLKTLQSTPWQASQSVLALKRGELADMPAERQAYVDFVRAHTKPGCACWREFLAKPGESCVFISGWVLAALASVDEVATEAELRFLLSQQHDSGAWSMFPARDAPQHAAPYATAWALMGLHRQRQEGAVPAALRETVDSALQRGVTWLLSVREGDAARWKRYPSLAKSEISVSVSGTVLHALHRVGAPNLTHIDTLWLQDLPEEIAGAAENPYVIVQSDGGPATDYWEQVKLPWVLAATVDAFASGSRQQKARALVWLEAQLSDPRVLAMDTDQRPWWRAEFLYALRYAVKPPAAQR